MGLVGESGCGKTTLARAILGALPANAERAGRRAAVRRTGPADARSRAAGRTGARPRDHLRAAGSLQLVQSAVHRRRPDHGADALEVAGSSRRRAVLSAQPSPRRSRTRAGVAARRAASRSGATAAQVSARAVGRPAAARDDRHGAAAGTQAGDRRRTDDRARRDHPGADPEAAAPAGDRARRVGAVRHARSRHRLGDLRPRHRDVCRPGTGDRADRRILPRADGALHAAAAGQPAVERFAAARHRRRRAEPDRAAARLPLPSALSARRPMRAATSIRRRASRSRGIRCAAIIRICMPVVAA